MKKCFKKHKDYIEYMPVFSWAPEGRGGQGIEQDLKNKK